MRKWEDSKADRKIDAAGQKRTGMTPAQWEKSPQDKKADAAAQKKMGAKKK
jgi:hypothetical protein